MRVVDTKKNGIITIRDIDVGEAFVYGGLLYIKSDEVVADESGTKCICMNTDGILFRFSVKEIAQPINATLFIGDYNEEG